MLSNTAILLSSSLLAAFPPMCLTSPIPDPYPQYYGQPPQCHDAESFRVDKEDQFDRPAKRVGGFCCDTDGCTLAAGKEHTVGLTVTTGANLDLNFGEIASAGINTEISYSVEDTKTTSAEVPCAAGYKCCLAVIETMVRVSGVKITEQAGFDFCTGSDEEPYEFEAPKTVNDGGTEVTFIACIGEGSANQVETDDLKLCPEE